MAFNAKNLHYEKQEPAFLRRLRGENTSDRHTTPIARPRKPRLETGDDDGPTIVDEQGSTVTKQEYEDLLNGKTNSAPAPENAPSDPRTDPDLQTRGPPDDTKNGRAGASDKPHEAVNSALKKRKRARAIAAEPETEFSEQGAARSEGGENDQPKTRGRPKKQKVRLSFDDCET